jgi:hypothetical protein
MNYLTTEAERYGVGKIVYTDGSFEEEEVVGFTPSSMYEFIIDGKRLY